jgi:protein PsiE
VVANGEDCGLARDPVVKISIANEAHIVLDPKLIDGKLISTGIHQVENAFLLVIATFTIVAMGQEVWRIVQEASVQLKDLLLMFIYVEVLGMIGAYYDSKRIPITLPLFIAMTALARLIILQSKDQPPVTLIYESGAIMILAAACLLVSYKPGSKSLEGRSRDGKLP